MWISKTASGLKIYHGVVSLLPVRTRIRFNFQPVSVVLIIVERLQRSFACYSDVILTLPLGLAFFFLLFSGLSFSLFLLRLRDSRGEDHAGWHRNASLFVPHKCVRQVPGSHLYIGSRQHRFPRQSGAIHLRRLVYCARYTALIDDLLLIFCYYIYWSNPGSICAPFHHVRGLLGHPLSSDKSHWEGKTKM